MRGNLDSLIKCCSYKSCFVNKGNLPFLFYIYHFYNNLHHCFTMKKNIECLLILLCCCGFCAAQQVVSSGGCAVKSDISINWILGGDLSNNMFFDNSPKSKINEVDLIESEFRIKAYPIPARDFIKLEITPFLNSTIAFEFYNDSGLNILSKLLSFQPVIQLYVGDLPAGNYFLKIFSPTNSKIIGIKKIVKN